MATATNCQQVACLPSLMKSAIENADVLIKRFNLLFFLGLEIIFILLAIILILYMSADSVFVSNFLFK